MNSDITFPAAGDGCFYFGLGGKKQVPNPSYQPYQCCPTKPKVGSKVPKITASSSTKPTSTKRIQPTTTKPFETARKDSKTINKPTPKPSPSKPAAKSTTKETNGDKGKGNPATNKQDKAKGKKGFFGTGKYIWWW